MKVNTGGQTFQELRENNRYYVDKTLLIKDIIDSDECGVYLYVRPRRFGKTTNITMLDAFFNIEYRGNRWFDGLAISRFEQYDVYKNRYPVVFLDLKNVAIGNPRQGYQYFLTRVRSVLSELFVKYDYLLESDKVNPIHKDRFSNVLNRTVSEGELPDSILLLCRMLKAHHGEKAVVLIDEYDRAITDTFGYDLQKDIMGFMSELMSATLKGNDSLRMAYVTGVMQVAKMGMFSSINNLSINNVFSVMSDERFGFTEPEVRGILTYYGKPDRFDEVREWYDGYRFGNADVYNPYSVMNYVSHDFVADSYWINTSNETPIRWLLQNLDMGALDKVTNILNGSSADSRLLNSFTYSDVSMMGVEGLFSLMVMTGYLRATPKGDRLFELTIPNKEVMEEVESLLNMNGRIGGETFARFRGFLLSGDAKGMATTLEGILNDCSYYILDGEASYELILLTMMHDMLPDYHVRSEAEAGNGRADLILTPRKSDSAPIIIEIKTVDSEAALEKASTDAIRRIHDRRYYMGMKGDVILIGMAFFGKIPKVEVEIHSV